MIFYFFGLSRQARLMLSVGRVIDRRDPAIPNPDRRRIGMPINRRKAFQDYADYKKELGAANRTRTCDPVITNDVLYQLSYCGGPNDAVRPPACERLGIVISGTGRLCKNQQPLAWLPCSAVHQSSSWLGQAQHDGNGSIAIEDGLSC
jgi:hypothetical protein